MDQTEEDTSGWIDESSTTSSNYLASSRGSWNSDEEEIIIDDVDTNPSTGAISVAISFVYHVSLIIITYFIH
jgi:hypothetical protein